MGFWDFVDQVERNDQWHDSVRRKATVAFPIAVVVQIIAVIAHVTWISNLLGTGLILLFGVGIVPSFRIWVVRQTWWPRARERLAQRKVRIVLAGIVATLLDGGQAALRSIAHRGLTSDDLDYVLSGWPLMLIVLVLLFEFDAWQFRT